MKGFDVIIIGAGAAGLMCAAVAGQRGRRVLLLDHAAEPGRKILISGGGRCNFTNTGTVPERFFSANRHFARSALARYTAEDFCGLVAKHGIASHEKTLGQLFCDGSARSVVAMLLAECGGGRRGPCGSAIASPPSPAPTLTRSTRTTAHSPPPRSCSRPAGCPSPSSAPPASRMTRRGSSACRSRASARRWCRCSPTTTDIALMRPLSGVALPVEARCGDSRFREALLFTHRGLSGPAILQVSSAWCDEQPLTLDLLPGTDAYAALKSAKATRPRVTLRTVLATLLPQRLADALATRWPGGELANLPDRLLAGVAESLSSWSVTPSGTEGYAKAEVTLGGVDTGALSSRTMEAKAVPGLFVVGEAVDVTGWLGGYNFQWAWSSGWCAGMAA